jgi:ABC-2 type transport system ATP-binding protein
MNFENTSPHIPSLEANNLSHTYGQYQALKETDLVVDPGEIIILSGPNGAGKTTLLLCLSGLLHPSSGQIQIEGHDLYRDETAAKARLAFVPDVPRFYTELTAWEHLHFIALAYGVGEGFELRAEKLLKDFGLWEGRNLFPHHYSRGMRLKLGLAMALIRPMGVLLLDEPTSALDVDGVKLVYNKLLNLRAQGVAIILSSHDPILSKELGNHIWEMRDGILNTSGVVRPMERD